jgi:hypothetical protein
MTAYPRRYTADLERTTSIRLSDQLREQAERAATFSGMTFSQFVRQSLNRNISLCKNIEEEVARQNFRAALGQLQ